jgi:4-alpha-glucanotransferase
VLRDTLGEQAEEVAQRFMEEHRPGQLRFREPYRTQRGVEAALKEGETALKAQLFDLLSEVLLIEDRRAPAHYHPRIAMHSTRSYRALDEQQQRALDAIYVDFFYHRHNQFWKALALRKLPAVRYATGMMACGEDLGMVPSCVPEVMQALSLLSLIIQRMPSDSSAEFARLEEAPYLSVCSPGSHDTSGLREWWEEDREATQRFYRHVLRREGKAPAACEPWVAREIILQHLRAPSAWAVFPLQDLLATDAALRHPNPRAERINVPGNPHHYWRYRMHLTLEALLHRPAFAQSIRGMVAEAGRGAL